MNIIKRIRRMFWKVGSKITIDPEEMEEWKEEGCPLCHNPSEEEIKSGVFTTFNDNDLCLKHLMKMQCK